MPEARQSPRALGVGTHRIWTSPRWPTSSSDGTLQTALEHLQSSRRRSDSLGIDDVDLSPAPELVEILIRLGDPGHGGDRPPARTRLKQTTKGQPWPVAPGPRAAAGMLGLR